MPWHNLARSFGAAAAAVAVGQVNDLPSPLVCIGARDKGEAGPRPALPSAGRTFAISLLICGALAWSASISCRQESDEPQAKNSGSTQEQRRDDLLVFPAELRVDDPAVNEFVEHAMAVCAGGDYERFRLLWSAKDDPLPREEYEQGWQAVQRIEIRALERVIVATGSGHDPTGGDNAYVLFAEVNLDPNHRAAKHEPRRDAVMLLIQEQGEWRLAHAPKGLRAWIKEQAAVPQAPAAQTADLPQNPTTDD
jgi:hypothetical protein